jgi:hypothetical protein
MLSMHANIQATGWPILPAGEIVEMLQQTGAHRRAVRRQLIAVGAPSARPRPEKGRIGLGVITWAHVTADTLSEWSG